MKICNCLKSPLIPLFQRGKFLLFCLILVSCAAPPKPEKIAVPELKPAPFAVSEVSIDRKIFNPDKGEVVTISFRISQPSKAIVKIFDPDMRVVRELPVSNTDPDILNTIIWDGMDMEDRTVPDEAYFFTVETMDYKGNLTYYDPTMISGGELFVPESIHYHRENGRISYELPNDARVRMGAGISSGGPLLKNILDWSPRLAGHHEEPWDGKDNSRIIDIEKQRGYRLIAEAVTLPENSIIASGNTEFDYFTYKNEIAWDRPEKEKRPLFHSLLTVLGIKSGILDRRGPVPEFRMELHGELKTTDDGTPVVEGKVPVNVRLDENIKRYVTEQRYEIIFFVDFAFTAEAEEGYSPFTLVWNTEKVSNGEHIITINVATLGGQVGSSSMKVMVEN